MGSVKLTSFRPGILWGFVVVGCGFRSGLDGYGSEEQGDVLGSVSGKGGASVGSGGTTSTPSTSWTPHDESLCPSSQFIALGCTSEHLEGLVDLCNDLDDDCDGVVDEGCACSPGKVKVCFGGPPARRGIGACRDGQQICESTADGAGRWGPCWGGITPQSEACDALDNDCDGCTDEVLSCNPSGTCPGKDDPRIPQLRPFESYDLKAKDFFASVATSYQWRVEGGPCDRVAPSGNKSYELTGASTENATFVPRLSGDYTLFLTVTTATGALFECNWVVAVRGPGLRIEMCYPESDRMDLDLYLKRLTTKTPWFNSFTPFDPNADVCAWVNCEAQLRWDQATSAAPAGRANWGYGPSDLSECNGGPQGQQWEALGYCANPRLDIDNNLSQGSGLPENINIDQPREGDGFRIMVQNFTGQLAHPIVNVYCGGVRAATFGASPDELEDFSSDGASTNVGAMWRVADVTTHLTSEGSVYCTVQGLTAQANDSGYFITLDDVAF